MLNITSSIQDSSQCYTAVVGIYKLKGELECESSHLKPYRNSTGKIKPSDELDKLVKGYRKVEGARKVSPFLNFESNKSTSFNVFLKSIKGLQQAHKFKCIVYSLICLTDSFKFNKREDVFRNQELMKLVLDNSKTA